MQLCGAVQDQWTCLVGTQIGIEVGDAAPKMLSPLCLSTSFSIVSSMKDDRLKGRYIFALVQLALSGLGVNVRSWSGYGLFIVALVCVRLGYIGSIWFGFHWVGLGWIVLCCVVLSCVVLCCVSLVLVSFG